MFLPLCFGLFSLPYNETCFKTLVVVDFTDGVRLEIDVLLGASNVRKLQQGGAESEFLIFCRVLF